MNTRYPHLSRLKIPFAVTNTDALVTWLMRIAETKPFLDEYLGTPQEVKLLRKAKVRAITYSNQIEGNTPEARHRKILAHAKKTDKFSMQDVVGWLADVPRRTLERDVASLVKKRALKTKGELMARSYSLAKFHN